MTILLSLQVVYGKDMQMQFCFQAAKHPSKMVLLQGSLLLRRRHQL
jgi:hypothetical protein